MLYWCGQGKGRGIMVKWVFLKAGTVLGDILMVKRRKRKLLDAIAFDATLDRDEVSKDRTIARGSPPL